MDVPMNVPMVVRRANSTRENTLQDLGMNDDTIATKKMMLVSFDRQSLKDGASHCLKVRSLSFWITYFP